MELGRSKGKVQSAGCLRSRRIALVSFGLKLSMSLAQGLSEILAFLVFIIYYIVYTTLYSKSRFRF